MTQELQRPVWAAWWADGRPGAMTPETYGQAMLDWVGTASTQRTRAEREVRGVHPAQCGPGEASGQDVSDVRGHGDGPRFREDGRTTLGGHHRELVRGCLQCLPLIRMWAERAEVPRGDAADTGVPLIDDFRTRGGRSIPMWVVAETSGAVLGQWGPRPETARRMVLEHKEALEPKPPYAEFAAQVQLWYARDRGREIEREAREMLTAIGRDATLHS